MYSDPKPAVDDNFDFIVLDSLQYLVEAGLISEEVSADIKELYIEADKTLSVLSWQQEDKLLSLEPQQVKKCKLKAKELIRTIKDT